MKDPWESDTPDQQSSEAAPEMETPEAVTGIPKRFKEPEQTQQAQKQMADQNTIKKVAAAPLTVSSSTDSPGFYRFGQASLIQGVIWAEILGKPKARRGLR